MIRTRSIIAACTLALLAGCSGARTSNKAATTANDSVAQTTQPAQTANQAPHRPKLLQPIDRARTAADSMAARANRMNAAEDSIMH